MIIKRKWELPSFTSLKTLNDIVSMCSGGWDWDQTIISWVLLSSGLCGLNADNKLWAKLGLMPREQGKKNQCWGGSLRFANCNSGMVESNSWIENQVIQNVILWKKEHKILSGWMYLVAFLPT